MCKTHLPEPICQTLSVIWRTVESWARDGEVCMGVGGSLGMASPFPLKTLPLVEHKAAGYLCGESGQSHDRRTRFSLVMVWEYVLSVRRRNNKKRKNTTGKRTGGGGITYNSTIKDYRCGTTSSSQLRDGGNPFGWSPNIEFQIMAHLVSWCAI